MKHLSGLLFLALVLACGPARAEFQLSLYGGLQGASPSSVSGENSGAVPFSFTADWEGRSLSMPPYYGLRAEVARPGSGWRFGLEFTHAKVYASDATLAASGFPVLEFTDGLNVITLNAVRDVPRRGWTPYFGGGIGFAFPHVEVQAPGDPLTFGYQLTGPALRLLAGVSREIGANWSVFGEVQATWSSHEAELAGGGSLSTSILTRAVNLGVTWRF
jgi:lipid A oxidase